MNKLRGTIGSQISESINKDFSAVNKKLRGRLVDGSEALQSVISIVTKIEDKKTFVQSLQK